jgi:hypothetical protein
MKWILKTGIMVFDKQWFLKDECGGKGLLIILPDPALLNIV